MARHSFVPWSDHLESRELLSTVAPPGLAPRTAQLSQLPATPGSQRVFLLTEQQQRSRIENIEIFLRQVPMARQLDPDGVALITEGLFEVQGQLGRPAPRAIELFNDVLRDAQPSENLLTSQAIGLNRAFGLTLESAGASVEAIDKLQSGLILLAQGNTQASFSALVTSNDYSLVLQTAIGVGRQPR